MTFKPLLAATLEEKDFDKVRFPVLASPKLDGIRAVIKDGVIMSRNLKPIRNKYIQSILGEEDYNGLDGELVVGDPCDPMCYRNTSSGVMSEDGEPDFKFYVFDDFEVDGGFNHRLSVIDIGMDEGALPDCVISLEHKMINSIEELVTYEEEQLQLGYEGIMIRSMMGPYKMGRSTLKEGTLLKLKRFLEEEATIVGYVERMHNGNEATTNALGHTERSAHKENMTGRGDLGSFWIAYPTVGIDIAQWLYEEIIPTLKTRGDLDKFNESQTEFQLLTTGSGMTDDMREKFWADRPNSIGKSATIKFMGYGGYNLPRFPVFKGIREDK